MATPPTGEGAPSPPPAEAKVDRDHRLDTVEARLERVEKALEGLQDALYRHEVLQDKSNGELRKRTEPHQMARDLSQDARRRGL